MNFYNERAAKSKDKTTVCLTSLIPNKPHVTPNYKCPHVLGIRLKNIPQHFPFTSTSKIPLLKILAATFPVRPAPMMPTLRRCKAPTGDDWGFMGFLNSGPSLVMLIPRPSFTSPSCRSCRNPEVRSAQSYNALAKQGFWITKSSCWNWWSRREKTCKKSHPILGCFSHVGHSGKCQSLVNVVSHPERPSLKGPWHVCTPRRACFYFHTPRALSNPPSFFWCGKHALQWLVESSDSANIGKKQPVMNVTKNEHWHLHFFPQTSSTNKENTRKLGPCLVFSTACGMHRILRVINVHARKSDIKLQVFPTWGEIQKSSQNQITGITWMIHGKWYTDRPWTWNWFQCILATLKWPKSLHAQQ